jgi:chromosome segregation ATPase
LNCRRQVDQYEEKGEVIWAEELIQMLCTEIDGLRRTIREREVTLGDKAREIASLESARQEITEMRNETEAARDAFYEHKESWEKSITAELTAQVTALREQVVVGGNTRLTHFRAQHIFAHAIGETGREGVLETRLKAKRCRPCL